MGRRGWWKTYAMRDRQDAIVSKTPTMPCLSPRVMNIEECFIIDVNNKSIYYCCYYFLRQALASQADLKLAMEPGITLNFRSSCLYLQNGLLDSPPCPCGADSQTLGLMNAKKSSLSTDQEKGSKMSTVKRNRKA